MWRHVTWRAALWRHVKSPVRATSSGAMSCDEVLCCEMPCGSMPSGEMPCCEMQRSEMPCGQIPCGEVSRGRTPCGRMSCCAMSCGDAPCSGASRTASGFSLGDFGSRVGATRESPVRQVGSQVGVSRGACGCQEPAPESCVRIRPRAYYVTTCNGCNALPLGAVDHV